MALHSGVDTVAVISHGVFTKTYGSANPGNIANLFVSFGLFEDAPKGGGGGGRWLFKFLFGFN